ncbi:MAG: hypothetical protein HY231_00990 [Acidobacteria bacterium]|nr:hypothetical protein [Acidobacteriota bacterium]
MRPAKAINVIVVTGWITCGLLWTASTSSRPHGVEAAPKTSSHKKIGKTDCKQCHAALVSQKNVHPPAAESCDSCHEYIEKGETAEVKLTMPGNDLCYICHAEKQEELKKKSTHPPAEAGCTTCHNPHSSNVNRMLNAEARDLCFTCHADKEEELKSKKFVHLPAKEADCVVCHNPHAADFSPVLKAETKSLCLSCHGMNVKHQKDADGKIKLFSDTLVAVEFFDSARKILLGRDDKGHPYIGHPVSGVPDPSKAGAQLSCSSCHNPHAGNVRRMLRNDLQGQALCQICHSK